MEKKEKQAFQVGESSVMNQNECPEEKFVWPWLGLVTNIPTHVDKPGRRVGDSGATLRDELTLKGFNPTRVSPIWNFMGHSGYALVEFDKGFKGFENAMKFERSYELDRHGKRDWDKGGRFRDDKVYGWVAREEDYNEDGIVGKHVRTKRDLKSVSQIQEEENRKMQQLVENMSKSLEEKKKCKEELEKEVSANSKLLQDMALHNLQLNNYYAEEVEKMQRSQQERCDQFLKGREKMMSEIEEKKKKLEERARLIEQQANINQAEMEKSRLEREKNQKAMWEQNEANREAMQLAEKHQKEKEKHHQRIMDMEAKRNEMQELELEIEKLKGKTNVMNHMAGTDAEFLDTLAKTQIELEARETALHEKMSNLVQKERVTNDEYHDARKMMIQLWNQNEKLMSGEKIRVKRMGQLNPEPFVAALTKKHRGAKAKVEIKAMELCSTWEAHIGDIQWHPFKVDVSNGPEKRVVDKNDKKLIKLKNEYGVEVHNEVIRARLEIEEYNASGTYVVLELWNYEQNRKATMEEATGVMLKIRDNLVVTKNKRKKRV